MGRIQRRAKDAHPITHELIGSPEKQARFVLILRIVQIWIFIGCMIALYLLATRD